MNTEQPTTRLLELYRDFLQAQAEGVPCVEVIGQIDAISRVFFTAFGVRFEQTTGPYKWGHPMLTGHLAHMPHKPLPQLMD